MARLIEVTNRDDYRAEMLDLLTIDPAKAVMLTVDMQRDYLDPEVATAPVPADEAARIVADTAAMLDHCRGVGVPVVHCYVSRRPQEARLGGHFAPYAGAGRKNGVSQNPSAPVLDIVDRIEGSGTEEVMDVLVKDGDIMVSTKREMDSFYLTDLEMVLERYLKPDVVLLAGINTDTCVYATTFGASVRGYRPVVVEECVGSTRGHDQHEMALEVMSRSLAWVLTMDQVKAKLAETSQV